MAAFRVLQILPGIGPANAKKIIESIPSVVSNPNARTEVISYLRAFHVPTLTQDDWPAFCDMMKTITSQTDDWKSQLTPLFKWYESHLVRLYDSPQTRIADLQTLEKICHKYQTRDSFLIDINLSPPEMCSGEAKPPNLDEDFLVLSTIHNAKGQEYDVVYILHVADGCIPSDMATGSESEIEEERRILYVAMTRAKNVLYLFHPLQFFVRIQNKLGNRHCYSTFTRFIPEVLKKQYFECLSENNVVVTQSENNNKQAQENGNQVEYHNWKNVDVQTKLRDMWK